MVGLLEGLRVVGCHVGLRVVGAVDTDCKQFDKMGDKLVRTMTMKNHHSWDELKHMTK